MRRTKIFNFNFSFGSFILNRNWILASNARKNPKGRICKEIVENFFQTEFRNFIFVRVFGIFESINRVNASYISIFGFTTISKFRLKKEIFELSFQ